MIEQIKQNSLYIDDATNMTVWIFHSEGAKFSGGVFSSLQIAENWINQYQLSGLLTEYPLNQGVYDWAIDNDFFEVKKDSHKENKFIGGFTSGSQNHFHFENGKRNSN